MPTGRIATWIEAKGFGFIEPKRSGSENIFFHVSACNFKPSEGEHVTYRIGEDDEGRSRAEDVMKYRPAAAGSPPASTTPPKTAAKSAKPERDKADKSPRNKNKFLRVLPEIEILTSTDNSYGLVIQSFADGKPASRVVEINFDNPVNVFNQRTKTSIGTNTQVVHLTVERLVSLQVQSFSLRVTAIIVDTASGESVTKVLKLK